MPWYKNAVIYSLDVRLFRDANGDGVGDFEGLTDRLDYLSGLGVTALWLLPFFPSPMHDGGYDVTDYYDVDAALGGMPAFVKFLAHADELGLRVIIDLPLNHTSNEHRWFQDARRSRDSPYRDYYVWVDEPPPNSPEQIVFRRAPNPWTYDEEAGQYYLHRFYSDEPDLNHANPAVREEVLEIIEFWLRLGVCGIRVDAAPYIAKKSAADPIEGSPHPFLAEMHTRAITVRPDAMLMAEADVKPAELRSYFGDGTEMQVLFDFLLNNYFFLALAREEAEPLIKALGMLPRRPTGGQWANWVRNHDELDLERLTSRERADVLAAFAPDEDMQIYGRGIRRRFPPMVGGERPRMEAAYALLFALPGAPVIRYGEEIGMGDDLSLPERESVRTPMQWAPVANGGFSEAPSDALIMPVISEGRFGYGNVSVASQQVERDSFLAQMETFIRVRREHREIGEVEPEVVASGDPGVLVLKYPRGDEATVVVHNLALEARNVELSALNGHSFLFDVLADREYAAPEDDWAMKLEGSGYRWFKVRLPGTDRGATAEAASTAMRDKPH